MAGRRHEVAAGIGPGSPARAGPWRCRPCAAA